MKENMNNSKERLPILNLMVLEILKKHSSEENQLRQSDILRFLKEDYDMVCDRRHVPDRLSQLMMFGFDIIEVKHGNSYCSYYMGTEGLRTASPVTAPETVKKTEASVPNEKKEKVSGEVQEKKSDKASDKKKKDKKKKDKKKNKLKKNKGDK